MQILLNKRPEVNLCKATRVVPLFVACQYEHEQIARPLLKKQKNKISPLFIVHMTVRIS